MKTDMKTTTKKPSTKRKAKALNKHNVSNSAELPKVYIGGEEVTDNDIKAILLIHYAMVISTPRMRKMNLEFVLNRPKYGLEVRES